MKKIFFWAPYNSNIGTIKSVVNSIKSIKKYSKGKFKPILIDATNEWKNFHDTHEVIFLRKNKFDFRKFYNKGYLWSRFFYLNIFFSCIIKLHKILKNEKPDFFIAHLVTSLPLFLFFLFNYRTKLILRISGEPKLNFVRKFFWRLISKRIYAVTCPSSKTKSILNNIFESNKIKILFDPVLEISKINLYKKKEIDYEFLKNEYILAIGRLTKQKNFDFLIDNFRIIKEKNPKFNLIIIGDGEEKLYLEKKIKDLMLQKSVFLLGFEKNVYKYLNNAKCLILTSLYENPGHVLIEAAACNCPIISSDCPTGPREILLDGEAGFLFEVNNSKNFLINFQKFLNLKDKKSMILRAKKNVFNYTLLRHYSQLKIIIN